MNKEIIYKNTEKTYIGKIKEPDVYYALKEEYKTHIRL